MDIQKEIEISGHLPVVFTPDTELRELFETIVERKKLKVCPFAASIFYNLGRVHGIRQERARRKNATGSLKSQIIEMLNHAYERKQKCIYFFVRSYLGYSNEPSQHQMALSEK